MILCQRHKDNVHNERGNIMFIKGEAYMRPELPSNPNYREGFTCWRCGSETEVIEREPMNRVFCKECSSKYQEEHQLLIKEYSQLKIKVMFENAMRLMEKSKKVFLHEYIEPSKIVYSMAIAETEKFMSSHEIVVAVMLEDMGFEYEANFPILSYKVDFYVPELKICIEVDGATHQHKLEYDSRRDIGIRECLGREWEIVRIPTKYIEENPVKIIDAIEALAKEKRRLRGKNYGAMPYGFSQRENKHYDKLFK